MVVGRVWENGNGWEGVGIPNGLDLGVIWGECHGRYGEDMLVMRKRSCQVKLSLGEDYRHFYKVKVFD